MPRSRFSVCASGAASRSLKDYFLAGNNIPWWAISFSIVAAETSTFTIVSVPGLAYEQDFRFLQLVFGYVIGRVLVAFILIPQYFSGSLVTAYQLIERRFGDRLRFMTAGLFLFTRAAAEGVRVFAIALVIKIALGGLLSGMSDAARDITALAIVTVLTLVYTFEGGMIAVIWTDVVQLIMYGAGAVFALFVLWHAIPGGWATIASVAVPAGKFRVFDLSWNLSSTYTLWSGVIGGSFLTLASHGTDQLIVQRLLSARTERQSKAALLASGVAILLQFALFLFIGTLLFVFYSVSPPAARFGRTDAIFPTFIATRLPHVFRGLMIASILAAAMSNLSAALNSLSSTAILDFYAHLVPHSSDERRLRLSRVATIAWGVVLFGLAILARHGGKVLETGLSIASVAYGSLLGVFLLGVLSKRASEAGAMTGMACGLASNLYLWRFTSIPFTWYVVFGTSITFLVGYGMSWVMPGSRIALHER